MIRSRRLMILAILVLPALLGCAATGVAPSDLSADDTTTHVVKISSRETQIPATLVMPTSRPGPIPLVVMIHGHGGSREEAGSFTRVANRLASAGIASIRMDFPGCGESDEPFYRNNLTNMLADVRAAQAYAQANVVVDPRHVALLGYSMGGRLAALASATNDYRAIVMWAPAVENGASDVVDMLGGDERYAQMRATAASDGYVDFETFWGQPQQLGLQWFEDMEQSMPLDAIAAFRGDLLLIHGGEDRVVLPAVSEHAVAVAAKANSVSLTIIDAADHGFGLFDGRDAIAAQLIDDTVGFLVEMLP